MGFFDSFPPPEPPKRPRRPGRPAWRGPQFNIAHVALAVDAVLLRNETTAVYAGDFDVYPYGFNFTINTLCQRSPDEAPRRPESFRRTANPFAGLSPRGGDAPTPEEIEQAFHLSVRYADGRSRALDGRGGWRHESPPEQPLLSLTSGHGSESEWTQSLWAWGIPEEGDVDLVYRWPAEQVSESSLTLDGDALRDAAARAVTLWEESDDEGESGS